MDMLERVKNTKAQGYCCSETVMLLALEDLKKENPDLMKAMVALCGGFGVGQICGALSAACAVICMVDEKQVAKEKTRLEVVDWFKKRYGVLDCPTLTDDNLDNRPIVCPGITAETYEFLHGMLSERGLV